MTIHPVFYVSELAPYRKGQPPPGEEDDDNAIDEADIELADDA